MAISFPEELKKYVHDKCMQNFGISPDEYIETIQKLNLKTEEEIDGLDVVLKKKKENLDGVDYNEGDMDYRDEVITHWMPLPPVPHER